MNDSSLFVRLFPFLRERENKQEVNEPKQTQMKSKRPDSRKFKQTTVDERKLIVRLRNDGYTIREIADQVGRSTKTIHDVLVKSGINMSREKTEERLVESAPEENKSESKGEEADFEEQIFDAMGPILMKQIGEFLAENPQVAKAYIYKRYGLKEPAPPTVDEIFLKEVLDSPDLKLRYAENRLQQIERGGRTEFEMVSEWLLLIFSVARTMRDGDWVKVLEAFATSGELTKVVEALTSVISSRGKAQTAQPTADGQESVPDAATPANPPENQNQSPPQTDVPRVKRELPSVEEIMGMFPIIAKDTDEAT